MEKPQDAHISKVNSDCEVLCMDVQIVGGSMKSSECIKWQKVHILYDKSGK